MRQQCLEKMNGKPDILLACVGGGSNAIGLFHEFVDDADVRLIGGLLQSCAVTAVINMVLCQKMRRRLCEKCRWPVP